MSALGRRPDVRLRRLDRSEVEDVWSIDRTEVVERVYVREGDRLALRPEYHETVGWPVGERARYAPMLVDCFERGGPFLGAFVGADLIGASILDPRWIGRDEDRLQLKFLHVSRSARGSGIGCLLFEGAVDHARALGARKLYVSATNSENTIGFYLRRGCHLTNDVDPHLFELEPEDIHMEFSIPARTESSRRARSEDRDRKESKT